MSASRLDSAPAAKAGILPEDHEEPGLAQNEFWLVALAAIAYITLRIAGIAKGPELDDHDSNGYIRFAEIWRSADWGAIVEMSPDATFLYPFLVAIFSSFTGDFESAGRLVSLVADAIALVAIYIVARRLAGTLAAFVAVFLIAFNPYFIRFSYSILTEPLYVALICVLLAMFLGQLRNPTVRSGATMGLIAGLAFLTRIEGILFFAAIPFFQLVYRLFAGSDVALGATVRSLVAFIAVCTLLAVPQIWRVSHVMDTVSINGRSVWSLLLNNPDGKSRAEKIYGLDFHPAITNLDYLQANPDAVEGLVQDTGYGELAATYSVKALRNLQTLHDSNLVALVGIPFLAFSAMGFLALLRSGRADEALLIAGILATCIVAPLLHTVTLRHIAAIGPILAIFAGAGVVDAGVSVRAWLRKYSFRKELVVICLAILVVVSYVPGLATLYVGPDDVNPEYDRAHLEEPVEMLQERIADDETVPSVLSRKSYLARFAEARWVKAPWADLPALLRYMNANKVTYLFYSERHLADYPFAKTIDTRQWRQNFGLLYSGRDENGLRLALYALRSPVDGGRRPTAAGVKSEQ